MENEDFKEEYKLSDYNKTSQKGLDFIPTIYSVPIYHNGVLYNVTM